MLFNEPKLLKCEARRLVETLRYGFSALQRAEIAEMLPRVDAPTLTLGFSALQRAEIAEIDLRHHARASKPVSVLFNEPKLLK